MTQPDDDAQYSTSTPVFKTGGTPYPNRESHSAHRITRLLFKSCAAQEMGPQPTLLCIHIAHTEDAVRYRYAPRYWNSQLVETLGLPSERALRAARDKAVAAGWLHYERESNRQVGRYWVKIPPGVAAFDDSPIEPAGYRNADMNEVGNTGANDPNSAGFIAGEAPDSLPEKRRKSVRASIPIPFPCPDSISGSPGLGEVLIPEKMQTEAVSFAAALWFRHLQSRAPDKVPPRGSPQLQAFWCEAARAGPDEFVRQVEQCVSRGWINLRSSNEGKSDGQSSSHKSDRIDPVERERQKLARLTARLAGET